MKIAHFGIFSPNQSGQYGTIKDLILAERRVGIDAEFVDFAFKNKRESRVGLKDGCITTQPLGWADSADVWFCHSAVPKEAKAPVVCALHGRPEYSFASELYKTNNVISFLLDAQKSKRFQAYVTFWEEHLYYWARILAGEKIFYVPAPVDFDTFTPFGPKHDFGDKAGTPNIVIADMWREDTTPFNLVFAAKYFKENYYPKCKLHIYGVPPKTAINFLSPLKKQGLIGELSGIVRNIAEIYRSADLVITPNICATRIIRESLASGVPVVAPHGCKLTPWNAEPRDFKSFAGAMKDCYEAKPDGMKLREQLYEKLNPSIVGNAIKKICERVMAKTC